MEPASRALHASFSSKVGADGVGESLLEALYELLVGCIRHAEENAHLVVGDAKAFRLGGGEGVFLQPGQKVGIGCCFVYEVHQGWHGEPPCVWIESWIGASMSWGVILRQARMNRNVNGAVDGYAAARLLALAAPLDLVLEVPAAERAETRLRAFLGYKRERAEVEARRCVLLGRDRRLQHMMVFEAEFELLREAVAGVSIDGLGQFARRDRRGLLLVSLHYGPYSSLLLLVLARAAARGLLPSVTVLTDTRLDPHMAMPEERIARICTDCLRSPDGPVFWLFDRRAAGVLAGRQLAALLSAGDAVLVFPDGNLQEPTTRGAVRRSFGKKVLGFGRGASWLARVTGCTVASVIVRPEGNGHRVVFQRAATVEEALGCLLEDTVVPDPAPWDFWIRRPARQPTSPTA